MPDEKKSVMTDARKRANAKYDKENYQYISFKAKKGSRDRIAQAATVSGNSVNGFIRGAVNKAVIEVTGLPMEYVPDDKGGVDDGAISQK